MPPAGVSAQQRWRISHRGKDYGCFVESTLREMILGGKVSPDARLQREGEADSSISVADFLGTQRIAPPASDLPPDLSTVELAPDPSDVGFTKSEQEITRERLKLTTPGTPAPPEPPAADPHDTTIAMPSPVLPLGGLPFESAESFGEATRDRIVVLGRRHSGKTIYLASLYSLLWSRLRGLAARATSGAAHKQLMNVAQTLKDGAWPAATQASMELPLEIEYNGMKQPMVTLDFAGELFAKAFLHDQSEAREVKPLLNHLDRAAALILLVDPMVTVGLDRDAIMEDDFGLVQAVRRVRNSPGGEHIPVVLVLTKADLHREIVNQNGGPAGFVGRYFASLARLLERVQIYQVSAVQTISDSRGRPVPRVDSVPFNIDLPLLYCVQAIEGNRQREDERIRSEQARAEYERVSRETQIVEHKQNRRLIILLSVIFALGLIAVVVILIVSSRGSPPPVS